MSGVTTLEKPTGGARVATKPAARGHVPGGMKLGQDSSREARRIAAVILEVLAGARTPAQAAQALVVSAPRYYQLEARAMQGLVTACESKPRGPGRNADRELTALRRQHERVQRELARQQTLVRLAQRAIGLTPAPTAAAKPAAGKKRRRRPTVRALQAATHLQKQSQETSPAAALAEKSA
jgi:hypothetical protein